MQARVTLICLGLLLSSSLIAQSNPSSAPQQPAANPQVQTNDQATSNTQKDSDKKDKKKDDSDQGRKKLQFRLGGISVGAAYFSRPFFFDPFWPYGFYPYSVAYSAFLYDPFYSPFYGVYPRGFAYGPDKGEVKLSAKPKNAEVFLDGAYAGTADHLKDMWLDSGAYNLSISAPGRENFEKRIYVLSGKFLKIDAKLSPEKKPKSQTEEKP